MPSKKTIKTDTGSWKANLQETLVSNKFSFFSSYSFKIFPFIYLSILLFCVWYLALKLRRKLPNSRVPQPWYVSDKNLVSFGQRGGPLRPLKEYFLATTTCFEYFMCAKILFSSCSRIYNNIYSYM